jgi:hypothetical protein
MLRNILGGIVLIVILMAIAAFATAPPELLNETPVHQISGDLDEWLATSEREISEANSIIPGTEKRIRWYQGSSNIKTPYSVVYFHGFSATRQEIAPVGDLVADALQANLFETRLTGHGQRRNALVGVRAEDWLDDAAGNTGSCHDGSPFIQESQPHHPDIAKLRNERFEFRVPDLARRPSTGICRRRRHA